MGELISSTLQRCQEMPSTAETDLKDEFSFWAFFFSFNYLHSAISLVTFRLLPFLLFFPFCERLFPKEACIL